MKLPLGSVKPKTVSYYELNNQLNMPVDGKIPLNKDKEAVRAYFLEDINQNTVFFHSLREKIDYLLVNNYIEEGFIAKYEWEFIKAMFKKAYAKKFRFDSFMGAHKFYNQYALKTDDGKRYLERYEDRVVFNALFLADGDTELAESLVEEIIERRFQPATPTFLNAGRKRRGELVSCFPAGTRISMWDGSSRNIEDIKVGDQVITHTGSIKTVYETIVNKNVKQILDVKAANMPVISLTDNHPVLVYSEDLTDAVPTLTTEGLPNNNYRWIEAKDLRPGKDFVVAPYVKGDFTNEDVLDLYKYTEHKEAHGGGVTDNPYEYDETDGRIKYLLRDPRSIKKFGKYATKISPVKRYVKLDASMGRLLGYYLSEGHVSKNSASKNIMGVCFTLGSHEDYFIEDICKLSEEIFGIKATVNYSNQHASVKININSTIVGEFMYDLAGTGFNRKQLRPNIFSGSDDFVYNILIGAFRGDGCITDNKAIMDLVNPNLVRQLRLLSLRLGLWPSLRDYVNNKGNLTTSLSFIGNYTSNENFIYDTEKNLHRYNGVKKPRKDFMLKDRDTDFVLYLVQSVAVSNNQVDTVYNLEVEDDHSYLAEGIAVHNCFLLSVSDDMNDIGRSINSALQLSKRGGGVGINLTDIREEGAPIKGIENAASGVVPVMKLYEDAFSYANQLGQRNGAGAVYLNIFHADLVRFLSTKKENADEKIRVKTLSLGLTVPDKFYELVAEDAEMYLFSPYDVEREYGKPFSYIDITAEYENMVANPNIKKYKTRARDIEDEVSKLQQESGYPYVINIDTANESNPINGKIIMSNLCSEILQVQTPSGINEEQVYKVMGTDISCNLGSTNIPNMLQSPDFGKSVETAMRALTFVTDTTSMNVVPSIKNGNDKYHTTGLGAMGLHTAFAINEMYYGDDESLELTEAYFIALNYYSLLASNKIAKERKQSFYEFELSTYYTGEYFDKYIDEPFTLKSAKVKEITKNLNLPTREDWVALKQSIQEHGLYHAYRLAIAPTGSISYVNETSASLHPITRLIEERQEKKTGKTYYPAPQLSNTTLPYYESAYDIDMRKQIDVYAVAQTHIDQGMSLTLFMRSEIPNGLYPWKDESDTNFTTRDLNILRNYAWNQGIKSIYYVRTFTDDGDQLGSNECESCMI